MVSDIFWGDLGGDPWRSGRGSNERTMARAANWTAVVVVTARKSWRTRLHAGRPDDGQRRRLLCLQAPARRRRVPDLMTASANARHPALIVQADRLSLQF